MVFETGGTKLAAGVADADANLLETMLLTREASHRAQESLRRLLAAGSELRERFEVRGAEFQAVGFGYGGAVDRATQRPLRCMHEDGWEEINLKGELETAFGLPYAIENDCKLAALAEAHRGAGVGARTMLYLTLGTGVGGGIIRDGRILELSPAGEAEIGHLVVDPEGPPCPCGGRGCVEAYCSGPGLSDYADWLADRQDRQLPELSSHAILHAWRSGDTFLAGAVETAGAALARGLAAAIGLLAPDRVVIGGGLGAGNPDFIEMVAAKTKPLVVPYFRERYSIRTSALRENVVPQGAALLAAGLSR